MKARRIAIFSASVGAGHTRAAEALVEAARGLPIEVVHHDALQLMPRAFQKLYRDAYLDLVNKAPQVFSWLFELTDKPFRPDAIRMALEEAGASDLYRFLDEFAPDLVLCTHFLPMSLVHQRREKGKGSFCLATVVTDFDVHGMWLGTPSDHYFLAVPEARAYLRSFGVSGRAISVTGIPTHPVFSQPRDRRETSQALGLSAELPTLLVSAGGFGTAKLEATLKALCDLKTSVQVVAICGRNEKLKQEVEEFALGLKAQRCRPGHGHGPLLHAIGFTEKMDQYMSCTDLMLGKPGGLTTWESFVKGLAWVVVDPIPGQEERNTFHLLEEGVGIWAYQPRTLAHKIDELLKGNRLAGMRANSLRMARPNAAREILEICSDLLS
jgi:processive 1,2-diacylglycerol beta-glucosyltransferase